MARRETSPRERTLTEIHNQIQRIKYDRDKLAEGIVPTTWQGKAKSRLFHFLPQLREHLQDAPLASLSAELRKVIFELYNALPEILRDAKERVAFAQEAEALLSQVTENPEDEDLLYSLERLLNQEAEEKLNLRPNAEAEAFIEEVQRVDPNFQANRRNQILAQAKRFLDINGPALLAAKHLLISSVGALAQLKIDYADVENQRVTIDRLHTTAGHIIRGQELGITAFNTVMGELELVVAAAELVHDAAAAGRDFADVVGPQRLQKLQDQADALEQKLLGLKSPDQGRKSLPQSTKKIISEIV